MSTVTRALVTVLAMSSAFALPAPAVRAQTSEAVPQALIDAWTWRRLGAVGDVSFSNVVTDTSFPYRICGTSGAGRAACVPSRAETGLPEIADWITFRSATPVAVDPTDADVIYGGAVERFDRRTSQFQNVAPALDDNDRSRESGLLFFAPADPRTLYFASSVLRKTSNSGINWMLASPTLAPMRISAAAISPVDARTMWIAGDDALHVTRDGGGTWTETAPPSDAAWKTTRIEASHFDPLTAYISATEHATSHTWAFRTRDGGRTWRRLETGLPAAAAVNVVREDSLRRGLLFAGTSNGVFISTDDGDSWTSLTLNLPSAAIADLAIRDADLIAAVADHGFWILDNLSPLRQLTADVVRADAFLFRPSTAWRLRTRDGTPGAVFHYLVGPQMTGTVAIEIVETISGDVIRRFSSDDSSLSAAPGLHRVAWDLRSTPVAGRGVLVLPGTYQVRMSVQGRVFRQAVIIRMDPRVRASTSDLDAQIGLSKRVYVALRQITAARGREGLADAGRSALERAGDALADALDALQQSDTRPTPALAARAIAAVDGAATLLAAIAPQ